MPPPALFLSSLYPRLEFQNDFYRSCIRRSSPQPPPNLAWRPESLYSGELAGGGYVLSAPCPGETC
ncbi:ABHD16A isoform 16 [Pan troglodytes]|uniref:Abhydrolase domain containing 16A, phospholipase n=2 Tax=Homininae TaxID=207598 RepID=F2Z3Q3_HUMAN|nr:abhydrolase domain containing 16A, phospholipase [Homo sapiens]PNI76612.1 ABHD16A isoform 4 [Pan troglodytes]KAI2541646.1 abhydrolase domain containing 16A, phospholipase [Homo sapiens]KAI4017611.1 abhydrolase domain containing 16A, phospholipase [Homo sapiens]KAI4017615.1 abhydrolase domain containing 16A, phospholipase [Homo sapiens]